MPVILATQEADIRRITIWSQPRQIVQEPLFQKKKKKITKRAGGEAEAGKSTCLGSMRPQVQTHVPPKEEKKKRNEWTM
jgi:hypothetical protein